MGGLDDWWGASRNWHKQVWEGIEDDPWRILTGFDPLSTEISNVLLNRDDEPLGDWLGGPTSDMLDDPRYSRSEKKSANDMKVIIPAIVGTILTGGALAGAGGAGGAGGGAAGGGGLGGAGAGAAGGGVAGGAGAASGGTGGTSAAGAGGFDWGSLFGGGGFDWGAMDWSSPGTYMDLAGMMPTGGMSGGGGRAQQASDPPPMRSVYPSMYQPQNVGTPNVYSPGRTIPFGLLMNDEDEINRLFGGIL